MKDECLPDPGETTPAIAGVSPIAIRLCWLDSPRW